VLGYHGCDADIARRAVLEGVNIIKSDKDYDWLGPGAYFWESDPQRALEWAEWKVSRGYFKTAAVVGAVIDLRNCLDLVAREDIELLRAAHRSFVKIQKRSGLPVPKNKNPRGASDNDRVLRFLDCAVLRHLHSILDDKNDLESGLTPFDTVRGMFVEGGRAYSGSGLYRKSHVQIAVRNAACVRGIFFPIGSN